MHSRGPVDRPGARVRVDELDGIEQLERHASACDLCRLRRDRTQVVTGHGPADADVLFVSDAPGYHDDRCGALMSRATGELFGELLELAGLRRSDVFVTSVVKCRPPAGRAPFPDEVEACEGWLFREIALVNPRIVVTLGGLALRLVTGRQDRLRDVHGTMIHALVQGRDVVVWPLYHPAAIVQAPSLLPQLQDDVRGLARLLAGARSERRERSLPDPAPLPVLPDGDDDASDHDGDPQLSLGF